MKKQFLLTRMLLLCALIIGSVSSAWGEAKTSTLTFAAKCNGSGTADDGASWTVTSDGTESIFDNTKGIHYGTNNAAVTYIQLSSSSFKSGTITKVVVNASGANTPSLSVTIGGKAFDTTKTGITTDNEEYTFNGSEEAGTIVIRLAKSSSAKKALYIKSVAVTYDDGPAKSANELVWSSDSKVVTSKDVTYSETPYNLPTLDNPHSLKVSYSSSNTSVATVDSEGKVTIKNITGSTTISATTEGDATYAAGTVSYTLNVTRKIILEDGVFDFSYGEDYDYGSGMSQDGNITEGSSSEWTSGKISLIVTNRYAWNDDGTMRIYKKTSSYDAGSITLTCPSGYVITKIDFTGNTGTGALSYMGTTTGNYDVSGATATWTGASTSVTFSATNSTYIKTISVTYTNNFKKSIGADKWATWVAPYNLTVPSGVTAYIATKSTSDKVVLTSVEKIKGGTAVILNGNNAEYTFDVTTESVDYSKTNLLQISDGNVSNGVFVLAKKNDTVGFYKWAGGTLGEGRVYLDAPAAGARDFIGFDFEDEMTTGINEVKIANNNEYFNLGGQRVAQPKKGLYIVNGKRVIIK